MYGSTRPSTALAEIAASTAWPPRASIWAPACAASGELAATMPRVVATRERPVMIDTVAAIVARLDHGRSRAKACVAVCLRGFPRKQRGLAPPKGLRSHRSAAAGPGHPAAEDPRSAAASERDLRSRWREPAARPAAAR